MSVLLAATETCQESLPLEESSVPEIVQALLSPTVSDEPKEAFLLALTERGETPEDLANFTRAILPYAKPLGLQKEWHGKPILDCCGTGGGGLNLLNVSTGILFILAALGVPVVKHGNRGVTKKSGSADVLEALGISIDPGPEGVHRALEEVGCAFVYAPAYHPTFKVIAPVRKKLAAQGNRTIFNLLGPLLNPALPQARLLGVFHEGHLDLFGNALSILDGAEGLGLVVCGKDENGSPIGEVSPCGMTQLKPSSRTAAMTSRLQHVPESCRVESLEGAYVNSSKESSELIGRALLGEAPKSVHALLVLNAAFALAITRTDLSAREVFHQCEEAIASGAALKKLLAWRELSAKS